MPWARIATPALCLASCKRLWQKLVAHTRSGEALTPPGEHDRVTRYTLSAGSEQAAGSEHATGGADAAGAAGNRASASLG